MATLSAGTTDHGGLSGLADDDHPQYAEIANAETITGVWTFSTQPVGIDHGGLSGLGDDDHTQYALLAGRSGGQVLNGGTAATEILRLRGSTDADLGVIDIESPITFDVDFTDSPLADLILWDTVIPSSGAAVISLLLSSPDITVDAGTFIISTVRDAGSYRQTVAPGFAVQTLFLAQPDYLTQTAAVQPTQAFVYAAQAQFQNDGAGGAVPAVTNHIGFSQSARMRATSAGDSLTVTQHTGLNVQATFNTNNAGATVNFGTFYGTRCNNIILQLFGQGLGTETMVAYYGHQMENITFGAGLPKAAFRSNLVDAVTSRFLDNPGGCRSDFGGGSLFDCGFVQILSDTATLSLGAAGGDVQIGWNGSRLEYDPLVGNILELDFATTDTYQWIAENFGTDAAEFRFGCDKFAFGQTGAVGNQVGIFVAPTRSVAIGGDWSDFLLTQAGNLTVNAAMGTVAGWTINAPSITLGTGSVTNATALLVGGNPNQGTGDRTGVRIISNPSGGGGVNAALYVTAGLSRFDGRVDINNGIALGGGAAATLGTIGGSGPTAAAQSQWVEIDIGGTAHWIPVWV